jgi:hypothetical protein
MIDLRTVASALGGDVSGGQVLAPGPGHRQADRSMSVKIVDGEVLVNSFAGDDPLQCKDYVRQRLGLPPWEPKRNSNGYSNGQKSYFVAEYIYKLADGTPYLLVKRTPDKSFPQYHWTGSAWQKGKPQGPKIPYRLPELIAAQVVYIVEGEKDADRLASLGLVATTSSEGAGKWSLNSTSISPVRPSTSCQTMTSPERNTRNRSPSSCMELRRACALWNCPDKDREPRITV